MDPAEEAEYVRRLHGSIRTILLQISSELHRSMEEMRSVTDIGSCTARGCQHSIHLPQKAY